jgi:hypothetical protein
MFSCHSVEHIDQVGTCCIVLVVIYPITNIRKRSDLATMTKSKRVQKLFYVTFCFQIKSAKMKNQN